MARKTLDEPPEPQEVDEVVQRVIAESAPQEPATPPAEGEAPPEKAEGAEAGPAPAAGPPEFEVDGKRYSQQDVRDLEAGIMRREEYDRQIDELRRDQAFLAEQLDLQRERVATERRLGKGQEGEEPGAPGEQFEPESLEERRLRELEEGFHGLQRQLAEQQMDGVNRHAVAVFERTVGGLLDRYSIPEDERVRGWLHRQTLALNPTYIENDRLLPDEQIARNTVNAFNTVLAEWRDYAKAERDRLVAELRRGGAKEVLPAPAAGPAPTPSPAPKREPRGMNPGQDAQDFMVHLASLGLKP